MGLHRVEVGRRTIRRIGRASEFKSFANSKPMNPVAPVIRLRPTDSGGERVRLLMISSRMTVLAVVKIVEGEQFSS